MMCIALLRVAGLVLKYARLPALPLVVVVVGNGLLIPLSVWLSRNVIDSAAAAVRAGDGMRTALPWVLAFVVVLVLSNLRELLEQILKVRIAHRLRDNLTPLIAGKVANLQYWCFKDSHTHDLIHRVGNDPQGQFTQGFWQLLFAPSYVVTLGGLAAIFMQTRWWVIPSVLLRAIPAVVLGLRHSTESYFLAKDQTTEERMAGYLSSIITGRQAIKETRLFGLNPYLSARWRAIVRKLLNERLALSLAQERRGLIIDIAPITFVFGAVVIFIVSVRHGNMTYGEFVALSGAMTELVAMVTWYIPYEVSELRRLAMYWTEFQELLRLPEIRRQDKVIVKSDIGSGIEFHNVRFKYPGTETEVLKGVSLRLSKGDKLAIVGKNGAGKSTIIKLLLGLYVPDSGRITVDGVDLSEIDAASRSRLFAAVFQDFVCYRLTARENIGFGNVERLGDDTAIPAAAERGMAGAIVRGLPHGLDTYLGSVYGEGTDLSVFFILDEGTCAELESRLKEAGRVVAPLLVQLVNEHGEEIRSSAASCRYLDDERLYWVFGPLALREALAGWQPEPPPRRPDGGRWYMHGFADSHPWWLCGTNMYYSAEDEGKPSELRYGTAIFWMTGQGAKPSPLSYRELQLASRILDGWLPASRSGMARDITEAPAPAPPALTPARASASEGEEEEAEEELLAGMISRGLISREPGRLAGLTVRFVMLRGEETRRVTDVAVRVGQALHEALVPLREQVAAVLHSRLPSHLKEELSEYVWVAVHQIWSFVVAELIEQGVLTRPDRDSWSREGKGILAWIDSDVPAALR